MPYATWKVMDLVDGHLSAAEVARLAGVTEAEVVQAMDEAGRRARSHERLLRPVDAELQAQITRMLGSVVGPIAGVLVEEAMEDLGAEPRAGQLFQHLSHELEPHQRSAFAHLAREQELA
ncbi:hypothetical protein [Deinococcus radiophilus]|uniref:hypothetical protein n=1 Tax=Deinococcus radiophilus TaxID=32062 RepID=UPI00361D1A2A